MKRSAQETQTLTVEIVTDMRRLLAHRTRPVRIMEVCGTHTVAIFRAGLRQILPAEIELVSGPGCPVCVTSDAYMDKAIAYAKLPDVILATFGDMLKVPGSCGSLADARAARRQVLHAAPLVNEDRCGERHDARDTLLRRETKRQQSPHRMADDRNARHEP